MVTELAPVEGTTGDSTRDDSVPRRLLRRLPRPDRSDLIAGAIYLLGSLWVTYHLLRHPNIRVQQNNINDDAFFQWALAHGARVLFHGANPFITHQMNYPYGVNLMANTSILGLSLPLAPVTALFGTGVSYALLLILMLAGTATSWYYVLSRHLVRSRVGAALGGAFCGFAPGMIAHSNGHPNIVGQFLVPFLIWRLIRLREPGRAVRNGLAFGLLVVWQAFINEEILFVTALGFGIFLVVYGLMRHREHRRDARRVETTEASPNGRGTRRGRPAWWPSAMQGLRGLVVAGVVAGVLLAYPLYVQFFGLGTYSGLGEQVRNFGADVTSFTAFASQSLGGSGFTRGHFAQNAAEENSFFGFPLVVLVVLLVWWLRRYAAVRALAVVGILFALMSLGPKLFLHGKHTRIPAPFALLNWLPLFDTMVPTRLALQIVPVIGILLAFAYQKMTVYFGATSPLGRIPFRMVWHALLVAALLPIAPRPLPAINTLPTPTFISSGAWHRYVPAGHSLVTVPLPSNLNAQPMFWSASTGLDLPIPRGYYLGPGPNFPKDRRAIFGAPKRPTSTLLDKVRMTGKVPQITPRDQANAIEDLRYWRGTVVVLQPGTRNDGPLWEATSQLLGFAPTLLDGVWLWDVRALVGPSS